jgi:hypothetical protein
MQHRAGCPIVVYSILDPRKTFRGVTRSAARPTAKNLSCSQKKRKILTR